jgi:hypothetical protein
MNLVLVLCLMPFAGTDQAFAFACLPLLALSCASAGTASSATAQALRTWAGERHGAQRPRPETRTRMAKIQLHNDGVLRVEGQHRELAGRRFGRYSAAAVTAASR